jgi:hypothetical protein
LRTLDKAKAEAGVQVAQRWIVAALRHRKFFQLGDLNEAIGELLDRLNHRPFRKRPDTSRTLLFEQLDRPALKALPAERYVIAEWKPVKPNIDYHVEVERHYYSVPYQLVGQQLDARYTATTVEIFHRGVRVASHARSFVLYTATTLHQHRPKSHQAHLEWTPSRLINWAATVGPATAKVVQAVLESKPHTGSGVSRLSGHYYRSGENLHGGTSGGGQPTSSVTRDLFLPQLEIHPQALSGSAADARVGKRPIGAEPR